MWNVLRIFYVNIWVMFNAISYNILNLFYNTFKGPIIHIFLK